MTAVQSVARATGSSAALRALIAMAAEAGWDVGLYDSSGDALAPSGGLRGLERLDVALPLRSRVAHRAEVRSLDDVAGHVVIQPNRDDAVGGQELVTRVANVLGDLCRLEAEVVDLAQEIAGAYEELNFFYELSASLAGVGEAAIACRAILEKALRVIPARAARILLREPDGSLRSLAGWGESQDASAVGALSVARICVDGRKPVLHGPEAALGHTTFDEWEEAARRSLVAVPVRIIDGDRVAVIGVLELRDRLDGPAGCPIEFSSGDVKLMQAIADQAALLLENARLASYEREVQLASHIQERLLPAEPPRIDGLEIAGRCVAARDVGGDFYDFLSLEGDALGLVVADVSGHNVAAALLQTATRATFRAAALQGASPAQMLATSNDSLMQDLERAGHFLTAWVARLDPQTGAVEFEGAGHPPALLLRAATGDVERLVGDGLPVGVVPEAEYKLHTAELHPGDVLVVYTDGLLEARDDEHSQFGEERLIAALRACADGSADQVADWLLAAVRGHSAVQSDDRTLVALKRACPETR